MSFAARVYARTPIWIQNVLMSAYGMRLKRQRYGRIGRETLARLREAEHLPQRDVEDQQLRTLTRVVSEALADVPFYRNRQLAAIPFGSLGDLRELPLLS